MRVWAAAVLCMGLTACTGISGTEFVPLQRTAAPELSSLNVAAFEEFRQEVKRVAGGEARTLRQDVSSVLRKPAFDEVYLGELFARHDRGIEGVRRAFVGLMAKVHEALDDEQRGRLAELLERGPRFGRYGFDW